ncbi:hypothetical protein [Pelagicoccus enzymogenes]|nr:hypothetical protein [Pelagicoccus enzymogenes]
MIMLIATAAHSFGQFRIATEMIGRNPMVDSNFHSVEITKTSKPTVSETIANEGHVTVSNIVAEFQINNLEILRMAEKWKLSDTESARYIYERIEEEIEFTRIPLESLPQLDFILRQIFIEHRFTAVNKLTGEPIDEIKTVSYKLGCCSNGGAIVLTDGTIYYDLGRVEW